MMMRTTKETTMTLQTTETTPDTDVADRSDWTNIDGDKTTNTPVDPPRKVTVLKKKDKEKKDDEIDGENDLADKDEPDTKVARREYSKEMLALKTADHLAVKEWLTQLSSQASILIQVNRREPKVFPDPRTGVMKKCDGMVGKYDRTVDEDEIQRLHGGGTYQLLVKVRNGKGNWEYFNARTIEIAGDPRLDDVPRTIAAPAPAPTVMTPPTVDPLTLRAFDFMAQQANRPHAPTGSSAADIASSIQAAVAPLLATIDALKETIRSRDLELAAVRESAGKGDPFKDQLLSKMLDTDNARITALRAQYDSEIRIIKEQGVASENRLRDQHQRDLERMERSHERELSNLKQSYDTQKTALETSQSTQKLVLDSENKRLEREITDTKAELAALRAKKEQSVGEKVKELKDLKGLFDDEKDEDDDEEKGTIERVIEVAGNLPVVAALAERLGNKGQAPAQQQQQAAPQQQAPQRRKLVRDRRTGAVLAPAPDGSGQMVPVQRVVPSPDGNAQVAVPPVDPATVKMAIEYMENAFRSGTKPEAFADSARPMIPPSVLGAIRALGIDEFIAKVAQLDGTSPLATQSGRNWRRRVAARLLGESDDEK
jgi:hypothetical protein